MSIPESDRGKVAPVIFCRRQDGDRLELLLRSLVVHAESSILAQVHVVCPDDDVSYLRDKIRHLKNDCQPIFLPDETVVGSGFVGGWHKQQLLKLSVATHIEADYLLLLDTDIVLVQPLSEAMLFKNGRAVTQQYTRNTRHRDGNTWFDTSAAFLDYNPKEDDSVLDVTPNILRCDILLEFLRLHPDQWKLWNAIKGNCSEYGLYWAFTLKMGWEHKHVVGRLHHVSSVWYWNQAVEFDARNLDQKVSSESGPFLVFQSNTHIPLDIVEACVAKSLNYRGWFIDHKNMPLVSCLMVTKNRLAHVKRAVACYQAQTYPRRELIVVSEGDDGTVEYINSLADPSIKLEFYDGAETKSLGTFRNWTVTLAKGEYCMQWDDDDFYHCTRIEVMLHQLLKWKVDAIFLGQWAMAWPSRGYYVISRFKHAGWEGSMLVRKSKMPKYPALSRGEDTDFVESLKMSHGTGWLTITEPGYHILYQYNVHQTNTWDTKHFEDLFRNTLALSSSDTLGDARLVRTGACLRAGGTIVGKEESLDPYACKGIDIAINSPSSTGAWILWIIITIVILIIIIALICWLARIYS